MENKNKNNDLKIFIEYYIIKMVSFSREVNKDKDENCKVGFKMGKFFAEGEGYKRQLKEIIMNESNGKLIDLSILLWNDYVVEFNNLTDIQTCEKIDENCTKSLTLPADVKRIMMLDYLNIVRPRMDALIAEEKAQGKTVMEPEIEHF
jgi:hypothetical protein